LYCFTKRRDVLSCSESEFLEEEIGSCLLFSTHVLHVSLLEFVLEFLDEGLSSFGGVHSVLSGGRSEFEVVLDHESGGEHVVVVNVLDERLASGLSLGLGLRHGAGDLSGASLDTTNEGVREFSLLKCGEL
jgi:hypothetical protein